MSATTVFVGRHRSCFHWRHGGSFSIVWPKGGLTDNATSDIITVTLLGNLLAQVDAQVGSNFMDRDEFVCAAVRHYVEFLRSEGGTMHYSG